MEFSATAKHLVPPLLTADTFVVWEVFCGSCGRLYQHRSLAPAFAQYFKRIWLLLAIPFAILFFGISPDSRTGIMNGLLFGSIAPGATIGIIDPLFCKYLRWRYPSRVREFETGRSCPECGSKSWFLPGLFNLKNAPPLPCPRCRTEAMTIDPVK